MEPLDHSSCANGHDVNCFCDVCDLSSTIGFTTCTCEECDPHRLADAYPRMLYTPPKETSRVIKSHTLRDDIVEICEESVDALCIYSVSRISCKDGFTGEIIYCLDLKEAEDVVAQYLAVIPCPKIAKPDAPVAEPARRRTWNKIVDKAWCETYQSGQFDVPRQVLPSDGFTLDD
jgi:hypothetical protein